MRRKNESNLFYYKSTQYKILVRRIIRKTIIIKKFQHNIRLNILILGDTAKISLIC